MHAKLVSGWCALLHSQAAPQGDVFCCMPGCSQDAVFCCIPSWSQDGVFCCIPGWCLDDVFCCIPRLLSGWCVLLHSKLLPFKMCSVAGPAGLRMVGPTPSLTSRWCVVLLLCWSGDGKPCCMPGCSPDDVLCCVSSWSQDDVFCCTPVNHLRVLCACSF